MFICIKSEQIKKLLITTFISIFAINMLVPMYAEANFLVLLRAKAIKVVVQKAAIELTITKSKDFKKAKKTVNKISNSVVKDIKSSIKKIKI